MTERKQSMMELSKMHLILLGDSTIDNKSYTKGGLAVEDHIRAELGQGSVVERRAEDGGMTSHILGQLKDLPSTATHLVLSVGGNDALDQVVYEGVLDRRVETVSEALGQLTDIVDEFEDRYQNCLDQVLAYSLPTVVCTIYNGAFPDPSYQRIVSTTVRLFDDIIMQCASNAGCPVIDLRRVCSDSADYFNPIEPGAEGGKKIASAILSALDPDCYPSSVVYPSESQSKDKQCVRLPRQQ